MIELDYNTYDFSSIGSGNIYFEHNDNGHKLNSFLSVKANSNKLVIFFQGAIDREKLNPPIFHRWSWHKDINANTLCINDPLLLKNKALRIGWYAGTNRFEYIRKYTKLIKKIMLDLCIDERNIVLYGSSAGGFAAVQFGMLLNKSTVIINNPQTAILDYHQSHVQDYLEIAYPGLSKNDVLEKYGSRVDLKLLLNLERSIPKIVYYQNIDDLFHYQNHFIPFIGSITSSNKPVNIDIKLYSNKAEGHSPMSRTKSVLVINNFFEKIDSSLNND